MAHSPTDGPTLVHALGFLAALMFVSTCFMFAIMLTPLAMGAIFEMIGAP